MKLTSLFSKPDPYKFRKLLARANHEKFHSGPDLFKSSTGYTYAETEALAAEEEKREMLKSGRTAEELRAAAAAAIQQAEQAEQAAYAEELKRRDFCDRINTTVRVIEELNGQIEEHPKKVAEAKAEAAIAIANIIVQPMDAISPAVLNNKLNFLASEKHRLQAAKDALVAQESLLQELQTELAKIQ